MPRRKLTTASVQIHNPASFPVPKSVQFDAPAESQVRNSSSTDPYTGPKWPQIRPGADDHKQFKSRGF